MSYYNVQQALDLFQKDLPSPMLPFDMPQLADLCRQGVLTPVFPYHLYISKPCYNDADGRPRYTHTQKFSGYLTHDHLISLIDGYTDSLIISYGAKLADESDILLFDRCQREPDYTECNPFTVTLKSIRLSADDVQGYITLQYFDGLTTPEQQRIADLEQQLADAKSTGSFMMGTPTVTQTQPPNNDQLIKELAAAKAQITDLENDLKQAQADNDQLRLQAGTPADADPLKGIHKLNIERSVFISSAKAIADYLWSMDKDDAIRTGDMVQQIKLIMNRVDNNLMPNEDKAIREWLAGIAPPYAKRSGRTPNNAPSEITLIMKK